MCAACVSVYVTKLCYINPKGRVVKKIIPIKRRARRGPMWTLLKSAGTGALHKRE